MNRESYLRDFEILELAPNANLTDVRKAYLFLKDLYSSESIASLPVTDELSYREKQHILEEIEAAYQRLLDFFSAGGTKGTGQVPPDRADLRELIGSISVYDGPSLRKVRECLGISIEKIAQETRVPPHHLRHIEAENFEELPPPVYTRGFVVNYAEILHLEPQSVAKDFMSRYADWKNADTSKSHRRAKLPFRG